MPKTATATDTVTAAQALIGAGLEAALEARRKAWFGSLDEALTALAGRVEGIDLERLPESEEFLSTVAATTRLALESHGATKLQTLRNVVLNTASGGALDDVSQAAFLRLVDRFSDLHIRVLRETANPLAAPEITAMEGGGIGIGMDWGIRAAFVPFAPVYAITAAVKDLEAEGLIQPPYKISAAMVTKAGLTTVCVTPAAERFLRFIGPPVDIQ